MVILTEEHIKNPIRICYLFLDSALCRGLVDASHQEVDLVDSRLHSKYLLHKNCMHANDSFFREGKSDVIIVDRSYACVCFL
jgi:hypothetical protein